MKNGRIIIFLAFLIIFSGLSACSSAEKSMAQRRNLMMPKKSDLPKNSKYMETKKKKDLQAEKA